MFGAIAGGIASALAGGAMSKLFGGGQKAASGGIQGDVLATDNNTVGMGDAGIKSAIQGSNVPNPDEAVPSFVSGAMARIASGRQIAINGHIKFNLTIPLQQLNGLETLVIIMVANKYAFLQITRRRFLNEWEAFKKVISRRNIRRRITIPLTLSNLKLLRRITRTENILHRNFTRRQVAIQNRVASNIGISQSTFSVKVLNLFSRSRRKTNKRKSKHSAMLRNKETRHRMFIGLLNTTRKLA